MATLLQLIERLNKPVEKNLISTKKIGSSKIEFISWIDICNLLDKRLGFGSWFWEILEIKTTSDRLILVGKLTIIGDDRKMSQMATGTEILKCSNYGDPSSNAEAMALRRCCAKFGLARYLWRKEKKLTQYQPTQYESTQPIKSNVNHQPIQPKPTKTNVNNNKGSSREISREEWLAMKSNQ